MLLLFMLVGVAGAAVVGKGDPGKPVYLTPYVEAGDLKGGQAAATVPPLVPGVKSYAGFFTVDPRYDSNLFLWYFPAEDRNAPVVVWLQGGPGSSSLYGLFYENGPLQIDGANVKQRQESWSKVSNLIFIDNPVGTGFSYTNSSEGYSNNQTHVGENLYTALYQFYHLFPELLENGLYITGESYAGKYVPALAYTIHKKNFEAQIRLNLQGVAMGNALSDPVNMMQYSSYLYQLGLIDANTRDVFAKQEELTRMYIRQEKWTQATLAFGKLILGFGAQSTMFHDASGFNMYYNFLKNEDDDAQDQIGVYLNRSDVRSSIHVGQLVYNDGSQVQEHMMADIMKSVAPWVRTLVDNYRVVVYNGQLDIIVAYPLTLGYLEKLEWCGAEAYKTAARKQWWVGEELAGYSKTVEGVAGCGGSFTEVLVRDAGHMVPHDQPVWALDLITRLVQNKPF